jgi:hypothetical protein
MVSLSISTMKNLVAFDFLQPASSAKMGQIAYGTPSFIGH